jgi:putative N6-adenine-specific DNA methylase
MVVDRTVDEAKSLSVMMTTNFVPTSNVITLSNQSYVYTCDFDVDGTFAIQSSGFSEVFSHSKYTALKTKDAIVDSFRDKHGKRPNVDVEAPDVQINVHVRDNSFVISLDSSGYSLHKRGYKVASVDAPINEVLAAALILLSDWNQISNFYDPMCGSATILV